MIVVGVVIATFAFGVLIGPTRATAKWAAKRRECKLTIDGKTLADIVRPWMNP